MDLTELNAKESLGIGNGLIMGLKFALLTVQGLQT